MAWSSCSQVLIARPSPSTKATPLFSKKEGLHGRFVVPRCQTPSGRKGDTERKASTSKSSPPARRKNSVMAVRLGWSRDKRRDARNICYGRETDVGRRRWNRAVRRRGRSGRARSASSQSARKYVDLLDRARILRFHKVTFQALDLRHIFPHVPVRSLAQRTLATSSEQIDSP